MKMLLFSFLLFGQPVFAQSADYGGSGNAVTLQGRVISPVAPTSGQVLTWNSTLSRWRPQTGSGGGGSGTVTSITGGTGLTGGTITTSGTLAVDVGTAANKIVQLTASAQYPAIDGNLITNINPTNALPSQSGIDGYEQLISNGTTASWFSPFNQTSIFDDFTWANEQAGIPAGPFGLAPGGNAGGGEFTPGNIPSGASAGRWGVIPFAVGTTSNATGQGYFFSDVAQYYAGQAQTLTLTGALYVPNTLSDNTNTYVIEMGFRNAASNARATNAMAILYEQSSSVNWQCYAANNGTSSTVTSSTAVASGWWNWKLVITATTMDCYIALPGASWTHIGQVTSHLPDSTHTAFLMGIIYKAATFAVQRTMAVDWIKLDATFASPR